MKNIVSKNCGHALSFIALLNVYSSVKEKKQESIFLVFVFLWSQPPRDGRHGRGMEEEVSELTSWVGSGRHRCWPTGYFAESVKR